MQRSARWPTKSGHPDAFPREGSKKVLDNSRVQVWDYSWTPGKSDTDALSRQGRRCRLP